MKWFIVLNLIIVIILFILLRRTRKQPAPSKLNFNKKTPLDGSFESVFRSKQENNDQYEKILNVLFQYNGETWDAYEVLGLPAGSSPSVAKKAYAEGVAREPDSAPFLKAALEAICHIKS